MQSIKTNRVWRHALSVVCFAVIFVLAFSRVSALLVNKTAITNVAPLYAEPKDSVDVVFLGTSRMAGSMYPTELFRDHGIVSNNFAQNGQPFAVTYYALLEAIEQQHPKVAVVDISFVTRAETAEMNIQFVHQTLDHFQNPIHKAGAVIEAIPRELWGEFFLPFLAFHGRWEKLQKNDFRPNIKAFKMGANPNTTTSKKTYSMPWVEADQKEAPNAPELSVLERIVETCREHNMELLLVVPPFAVREHAQKVYHWVEAWAGERQVDFVNLSERMEEMGFLLKTDLRDRSHANYWGGLKATAYIGDYLKDHYDLPDRREDEAYRDKWERAAIRFDELVQSQTEEEE